MGLMLDSILVSFCDQNETSGIGFASAGLAPFCGRCNWTGLHLQQIKLAPRGKWPPEAKLTLAVSAAPTADCSYLVSPPAAKISGAACLVSTTAAEPA